MLLSNYFDILKVAQSYTKTIHGPVVDDLVQTVNSMFGRGAPTVWDYTGFNKYDYQDARLQQISTMKGMPVPVSLVVDVMRILNKYNINN